MTEKKQTTITIGVEIYEHDLIEIVRFPLLWDLGNRTVLDSNKILVTLEREFNINHAPLSLHAWEEEEAKYFLDEIKKKFNDKIVDIYYY